MDNKVSFALENLRYTKVSEWKGEKPVDLREWVGDKPTKKGISLTLARWKCLIDGIESLDEALKNGAAYQLHLGGNVYCTVRENNPCVDVRQYWKPENDVVPCKKGLCLRPSEYLRLKEVIPDIGLSIPELSSVVPCMFQTDHANQLGYLRCAECNPNDFTNWNQRENNKNGLTNEANEAILKYSGELGHNWQLFAIQLGYGLLQIDDLKKAYPSCISTLLYVMLYKWQLVVTNCEKENTKKLLAAAFSRCGNNLTALTLVDNRAALENAKTLQPRSYTEQIIREICF